MPYNFCALSGEEETILFNALKKSWKTSSEEKFLEMLDILRGWYATEAPRGYNTPVFSRQDFIPATASEQFMSKFYDPDYWIGVGLPVLLTSLKTTEIS